MKNLLGCLALSLVALSGCISNTPAVVGFEDPEAGTVQRVDSAPPVAPDAGIQPDVEPDAVREIDVESPDVGEVQTDAGTQSDASENELHDDDNDGRLAGPADCDDTDPTVYVGAPEDCTDGKDNDCDGQTDETDEPTPGQPGEPGENGQNGTGIAVIFVPAENACPGGNGFFIVAGPDADMDGLPDEETMVVSLPICSGQNGQDGRGFAFLPPQEASEEQCVDGGLVIVYGPDVNNDGVPEVDTAMTFVACHNGQMPEQCVRDEDCPHGQICNNVDNGGTDLRICQVPECEVDADCNNDPYGRLCYMGECQPCDPSRSLPSEDLIDLGCNEEESVCVFGIDTFPSGSHRTTQTCAPRGHEPDNDRDGVPFSHDCNDNDPMVFPGAPERCNGEDDDCDGRIDDGNGVQLAFFPDADGDHFGDSDVQPSMGCVAPAPNMVTNNGDCDDMDNTVHPSAAEVCDDGLDNDCSGDADQVCQVQAQDFEVSVMFPGNREPLQLNVQLGFDEISCVNDLCTADEIGRRWNRTSPWTVNSSSVSISLNQDDVDPRGLQYVLLNVTIGNPGHDWLCMGAGRTSEIDGDAVIRIRINNTVADETDVIEWSPDGAPMGCAVLYVP